MRFSIIVLLAASVPNIAQADIRAYCADKWPADYQMQEHCISTQSEANHSLFRFAESYGLLTDGGTLTASTRGGVAEGIVARCMNKWALPNFNTHDYQMVWYCTENQVNAYKRINGSASLGKRVNSGPAANASASRSHKSTLVSAKPGETEECTRARQHLRDLEASVLEGTAQHQKQIELVAQCE